MLIFTLEEYPYRYSIDGRQNHRNNFDGATIDILTALSILSIALTARCYCVR